MSVGRAASTFWTAYDTTRGRRSVHKDKINVASAAGVSRTSTHRLPSRPLAFSSALPPHCSSLDDASYTSKGGNRTPFPTSSCSCFVSKAGVSKARYKNALVRQQSIYNIFFGSSIPECAEVAENVRVDIVHVGYRLCHLIGRGRGHDLAARRESVEPRMILNFLHLGRAA
jgi:hypothetical protein